jgi:hypothetical protein
MKRTKKLRLIVMSVLTIFSLVVGLGPSTSLAASHREAPLIALDPTADITDFFMFRSYETGHANNVVFIMNVIPGEEPSSGPNYYAFDPNVLYAFNVDTNGDGRADDVRFEIKFENEFRGINKDAGLFLSYVALPPITALDGPGSEGLGMRQKYTVTAIKNGHRMTLGSGLIAVPSNVGPRTMPDYAALAQQGVYSLGHGVRVFAGQREDPFYIDLGAVFDTLNLRRTPLPLLTTAEDADDHHNAFGIDMLAGFNVHTIALEVPMTMLFGGGDQADAATGKSGKPSTSTLPTIGAYAATYRRNVRVLRRWDGDYDGQNAGNWVQVQRLANPLINEAIIGTADKDKWNSLDPSKESQFLDYYLNPRLALALQLVFNVPASTSNRTDLRDLLLKYSPGDTRLSELLRLNLNVPPTPFAMQKRLGPLAHDASGNATPDPAAWPNGRRPMDDVTDVAVRVVGGSNYIGAMAGDGINTDDATLMDHFPFLATPFDGVTRVHQNP